MTNQITDTEKWQGRRYYPVSQYFRQQFGGRVAKISVSVAETCPNRSSKASPCIFCDEWGAAAYHRERDRDLLDQIRHNRQLVTRRLKKAEQFLVYFQSYTNTLDKVAVLQARFATALSEPYVKGLVVGTRPDCLPQRLLPVLDDISKRHYLMVELGAQSFDNKQLAYLKRGHTAEDTIAAIERLHRHTEADIGVHLMFGLPGETEQQLIEAARIINQLPVDNVKLHNLHVLENTELANHYKQGLFQPLELNEYAERVILFLKHLSPGVSVQRLAAIANRWDELVAPQWTRQKMQPLDYIEGLMAKRGCYQGDCYRSPLTIEARARKLVFQRFPSR